MDSRRLDPLTVCFVPLCKNKLLMFPDKHFFHVPKVTKTEWCAAVNKANVPKSAIYICEDHLNIEEDLLNYDQWKNNSILRPRLRPQVPKTLKNICGGPVVSTSVGISEDLVTTLPIEKAVLCKPSSTSATESTKPEASISRTKHPLRDASKHPLQDASAGLIAPITIKNKTSFASTEITFQGRNFILELIKKNPFEYIGVPKQFYWIVEYIQQSCKVSSLHIIITLYKIKNNDTFKRMKDLFEVSISTIWHVFFKTLRILNLFFKQFLYWPSKQDIKKKLPPAFRCNKDLLNVLTIINAFEIQIEKPNKPGDQALTWSQYKQCNTIKYLIGATPDGFITFISEGYGGCISNMHLVEQSRFLESVPDNATILADRGFKHLETHLLQKCVKVLRPPSIMKDINITNREVIDSKVIARLRIHIKRVLKRVRLFKILKPHAVVNNKLVSVLDDVIVVACGLINLQSPIVNN